MARAVCADTSAAPSSRWYTGSGIYRHVRLIETGDVHVPQRGAYVRTVSVSDDQAIVAIATDVRNGSAAACDVTVEVVLTDPDGREVARTATPVASVAADRIAILPLEVAIARPRRWNMAAPHSTAPPFA